MQDLVQRIVAAEDKKRPLSDEAIVSILGSEHGLDIARRTVTKYRKKLGIPSTRARRVYEDMREERPELAQRVALLDFETDG